MQIFFVCNSCHKEVNISVVNHFLRLLNRGNSKSLGYLSLTLSFSLCLVSSVPFPQCLDCRQQPAFRPSPQPLSSAKSFSSSSSQTSLPGHSNLPDQS